MSLHNNPKYQIPALVDALKQHGLEHNIPSQLADAFRTGWVAALAAPAQAEAPIKTLEEAIAHAEDKAKGNSACAMEHAKLAAWLTELQLLRADRAARGAAQTAQGGAA